MIEVRQQLLDGKEKETKGTAGMQCFSSLISNNWTTLR